MTSEIENEDDIFLQGGLELLKTTSELLNECVYVVDVRQRCFRFVSNHDLFLCGHTQEEVIKLGYNFYRKVVHPEDYHLVGKMQRATLKKLAEIGESWDEVGYFSCSFRLLRKYSFLPRPLPQMVCHQAKPVWVEDELRYFVCSVENSCIKKRENLRMYHKNNPVYEEYNANTNRWKRMVIEPLTEREKAILMLSQQGKKIYEIANDLNIGYKTADNQISKIFEKLDTHSMKDSVIFAENHQMIYIPVRKMSDTILQPVEAPRKRKRILLTEDKLKNIQKSLNEEYSINSIAKKEGVSEGAIRAAIKKNKLKKNS